MDMVNTEDPRLKALQGAASTLTAAANRETIEEATKKLRGGMAALKALQDDGGLPGEALACVGVEQGLLHAVVGVLDHPEGGGDSVGMAVQANGEAGSGMALDALGGSVATQESDLTAPCCGSPDERSLYLHSKRDGKRSWYPTLILCLGCLGVRLHPRHRLVLGGS